MSRKISIDSVNRYIIRKETPFGVNIEFPLEIDTSQCEEFFGTRCPNNIHVTGKRIAHKDHSDPRFNSIEHIKKDVGIDPTFLTVLGGAAFGALLDKENRVRGASIGGLMGLVFGIVLES